MNSREKKELRGYVGSGMVFLFVVLLLVFLSYVEIPETNNDTFKLITGALVATIGTAIYVFIGKDPNEVVELQRKNDAAAPAAAFSLPGIADRSPLRATLPSMSAAMRSSRSTARAR